MDPGSEMGLDLFGLRNRQVLESDVSILWTSHYFFLWWRSLSIQKNRLLS